MIIRERRDGNNKGVTSGSGNYLGRVGSYEKGTQTRDKIFFTINEKRRFRIAQKSTETRKVKS